MHKTMRGGMAGSTVNSSSQYIFEQCANMGSISSDYTCAGIVGFLSSNNEAVVKNCYNLGEISRVSGGSGARRNLWECLYCKIPEELL